MNTKFELGNALFEKCHEMQKNDVTDIKSYEIAFQDVIEKICPNHCWWEVTDCNIFMDLLEHKDPEKTVIEIIKQLKEI